MSLNQMQWQDQAACRGMDTSIWYPEVYKNMSPRQKAEIEAEARAICSRCPVRWACLVYAAKNNEPEGLWGGCDPKERRSFARFMGIRPRRTRAGPIEPNPAVDDAPISDK